MSESLFPEYDPAHKYAGTLLIGPNEQRYQCDRTEESIANDNVAMLKETIDRGWLTPEHRTFYGDTVVRRCQLRGAQKCAAHLLSAGFPI